MASDGFKLPGTSLDELEKAIEAYSKKSGPASNEDIAQLVGSSPDTVSRSNGFLVSVGILQGGRKKEATELGRKLGLALHHNQTGEAAKYWHDAVVNNEFLSEQVTAVRVQKAVKKDDLAPKILYNAKGSKNKFTETGSRTVAEILVKAGLLVEDNGTYTVSKGTTASDESKPEVTAPKEDHAPPLAHDKLGDSKGRDVQFAVNLQIQINEFEDTSKYDDLFRAIKEHLLHSSD
jgi:hypothetical protein